MLQKAFFYNMPVAVASVTNYIEWVEVVRATKVITYWWLPDNNFVDLDMQQILFEIYDKSEWDIGLFRTDTSVGISRNGFIPSWRRPPTRCRSP